MEGLKECDANLKVCLHPSKANCPSEAILSELSSMLFTYSETFEGVVLAYDPNIRSKLGSIIPGVHPSFSVKLRARLLLFNPKPDMLIEGEVVKITPQSIHAVVLGFASVFIADEDISDDFKHKTKGGKEVFTSQSHKKHTIKVGTILRFVVKSFDEDILHISGSLVGDRTGCARWMDKNLDKWSQSDSTTRKTKSVEGEDENPESETLTVKRESCSQNDDEHVNNAKKRRKNLS